MNNKTQTYTYRCGQKLALEKSMDQMIVRTTPKNLSDVKILEYEQVSSASTKIKTHAIEMEAMMTRNRNIAPTHHAYYETSTGAEFLITDRVFVTFKDNASSQQIDEFMGRYALVNKRAYNHHEFLLQLTEHTGINPVKLVTQLTENEPLIALVEHDLNQRVQTYDVPIPIDPEYQQQWHLHTHFNHSDYDPRSSTRCEEAWHLLDGYGSDEVVIAVADDGCKLDHQDFDSTAKFAQWGYLRGERLISAGEIDANPDEMYKTGANHGTSCCGVIAGEIDAVMTVGAAPACQLLPIQWESSGSSLFISDSKLLTVLDFIADKADVMSNSWGGVPISMWAIPVINKITDLALTGGPRGKGIIFLWAAGNENCLINHTASIDVPYDNGWNQLSNGSWNWVGVKSTKRFRNNLVNIKGLMHIAALASTAKRSHYSNYGPGMALCAPTSNSHEYSRINNLKGLGITTTTGTPSGVTDRFGGTSSATPLVAGIAGLVISANPNLSALQVVTLLKQTAAKDLNFDHYPRTPPASYNTDTSWDISPIAPFDDGQFIDNGDIEGSWSPWFGYGKVDALAAVGAALSQLPITGNEIFTGAISPDKSIPDNNTRGIKSTIVCPNDFLLESIKININITHSYISDLRLTLISPLGTEVVLHEREGGSGNDIHRLFDIVSVPHLHHLVGETIEGNWILHIQDMAEADRGRLQNWSIEIVGQTDNSIVISDSPGFIIPDNSQNGIERTLDITTVAQLDDIVLELDISHTFIKDLIVELTSPDNTSVLIHNHTGGSSDNIIKTYTLANSNNLQVLKGQAINGSWRLKVTDTVNADQGKLNKWTLKIKPL